MQMPADLNNHREAPAPMSPEAQRLEVKLGRMAARAVIDYEMIEEGDRILVAVSGGKDSYVMLRLLKRMQRIAPVRFELLALHLDQGHPGFPVDRVERQIRSTGVPYIIAQQDTYSIVKEKLSPGATTCSLCSRLRRGILYTQARAHGCRKVALGHHKDDLVCTLLLNLFYSGQTKTMAPKLISDSGEQMVIRPLAYCNEALIQEFADLVGFEPAPCTLCTDQDGLKREMVADMVRKLDARHPGVRDSIFASMHNIRTSHMLDSDLFDAASLRLPDDVIAVGSAS